MPGPFHVMAKPIGPLCNLDCTYCFYLEKEKLFPAREEKRPLLFGNFIRIDPENKGDGLVGTGSI